MADILTALSRYFLDTRSLPFHAIPKDATGEEDPHLRALQRSYPSDYVSGGREYDLPHGRVRVWVLGPDDSPKGRVVLVHGLSMPSIIWQPVAEALAENGYQVALYDLYGRGYTEAPQGKYENSLYVWQLLGVLDKLGWRDPVYLAGLSMGGPICSEFVGLFPEKVKKVALLAPAAYLDLWPSPTTAFGRILALGPILGMPVTWPVRRALARYNTPSTIEEPTVNTSAHLERIVALQKCVLPGYVPAITKSLQHGPIFSHRRPYELLKNAGRDILVIWGTADAVVPYKGLSENLMALLGKRATLHTVQNGTHDLPTTNHAECIPALLAFFQ